MAKKSTITTFGPSQVEWLRRAATPRDDGTYALPMAAPFATLDGAGVKALFPRGGLLVTDGTHVWGERVVGQ